MSTAVHRSPNKPLRFSSTVKLWSSFNILGKNNFVQYFVGRNEKTKKETKLIKNIGIIEK
jgi:predicted transcriptional regulator